MKELLLVSQSPRRSEILKEAGISFRVDTVKVSELIKENVNVRASIEALARLKAEAYLQQCKQLKSQDILLLTADTVVVFGEKIMGKPKDRAQAVEFLDMLSGKTHSVITALCLVDLAANRWVVASDQTFVHFRPLVAAEISAYVASGEPFDKAGGYGIQGAAREFVEKIEGSFLNVVGLPLELLEKLLIENHWQVARAQK